MGLFIIFGALNLVVTLRVIHCHCDLESINCEHKVYHLQGTGIESSLTLPLAARDLSHVTDERATCPIRIVAPDTHLIYVRFGKRQHFDESRKQNVTEDSNCSINAYVPEYNLPPAWTGDACSMDENQRFGLLPNIIMLLWRPPVRKEYLWHTELLITALGKKEFCRSTKQHTCIHVGWTPLVCVAEELLCDGVPHCPPGAIIGDENPNFCRDRQVLNATNWEKIATEFLRKFTGKPKGGGILPGVQQQEDGWQDQKTTQYPPGNTNNPSSPDALDNISAALAHYGPWGYLMLGMLLCGSVLMICGLWECCCRKPKPYTGDITPPNTTPTCLVADTPPQETPPRYEDLDQPPSYSLLFPNLKNCQEAEPSTRLPTD